MPSSTSFSTGVDAMLHCLPPRSRKQSAFPPELDQAVTRFNHGESIRDWFVRQVDASCAGDPTRCAVETDIALFASLYWRKKTLVGANISTLVVNGCDLEAYYCDVSEGCNEVYLRLDFDYGSLGDPFSHPIPHIHVFGDNTPRFALDGGTSGNVVMDYVEFIYRHFVASKWQDWASDVWNKWYADLKLPAEDNPFPRIMDAFKESQVGVLHEHSASVKKLKELLRARKDELFAYQMDSSDRELLEYPEAR